MSAVRPFRCAVPDAAIADLHARLDHTRWPDQPDGLGWSHGVDRNMLQELVRYWRHQFDWRGAEAGLNRFDQFMLEIDGLDIHFIHQRSSHARATPLLLCHGWPGSIVEFLDVIPRLTQPERFGGGPEDAFHVVCPSLPGYAFSPAPTARGFNIRDIAQRHAALMAALGYTAYIAQGGDWGAGITRQQAMVDPAHCRAIHLNLVNLGAPGDIEDPLSLVTPEEHERLDRMARHQREGTGYYAIQSTKPQTLAYALQDSPVGLCAWLTEKFHDWSDGDGDLRRVIGWDRLLTNIALYWFSGCIASSVRLYRDNALAMATGVVRHAPIAIPVGVAVYPREIYHAPRAWVERALPLVHWFVAERGGHFAALEQPQIFAQDLWRFKQVVDGL